MADKKKLSQAEKAVSVSKQKKSANKKYTKKSPGDSKKGKQQTVTESPIPLRFFTSVIFLGLFILFLVIALNPEGALITIFSALFMGFIGKAGFLVSIPVLLYLFLIHAFSGKKPVLIRSICLGVFVVLCGCVAHLWADPKYLSADLAVIPELYMGGASGATGGIICGSIAMLVKWLCGPTISYILFILGAVLTLLGGMQITVPGLIRAVQNRPRADWEVEDLTEKEEPAAVVVNTIAKKRIEYVEQKRQQKAMKAEANEVKLKESEDFIRDVEAEITTPVAVSKSKPVRVTADESAFIVPDVDEHVSSAEKPKRTSVKKTATAAPEIIPTEMP